MVIWYIHTYTHIVCKNSPSYLMSIFVTSHIYCVCVCVYVWEHICFTLSKFQLYKTVSPTVVAVLYIRASELARTCTFVPSHPLSLIPYPSVSTCDAMQYLSFSWYLHNNLYIHVIMFSLLLANCLPHVHGIRKLVNSEIMMYKFR